MHLNVKNFCKSCPNCIKNIKSVVIKTSIISKADDALDKFTLIDIVGELPRYLDGKYYTLTIIDHFSRHFDSFSLTNIISSIIQYLEIHFSHYKIPKIILSDDCTNFYSMKMEEFFKAHNIEYKK